MAHAHDNIVSLLPRLRRTAKTLTTRSALETDDLLQEAALSALEASSRVEAAHLSEAHASSVLYLRAVGGMRDAVRRDDPTSRTVYDRRRLLQDAEQTLQVRLGRAPSDAEVAAHLHLSLTQLWQLRRGATLRHAVSLDAPLAGDEESSLLGETLADGLAVLPEEAAEQSRMEARVREAIEALPERQQLIVRMLYTQECTLSEVATTLGVSPSRVSQLHSHIREALRALLTPDMPDHHENVA